MQTQHAYSSPSACADVAAAAATAATLASDLRCFVCGASAELAAAAAAHAAGAAFCPSSELRAAISAGSSALAGLNMSGTKSAARLLLTGIEGRSWSASNSASRRRCSEKEPRERRPAARAAQASALPCFKLDYERVQARECFCGVACALTASHRVWLHLTAAQCAGPRKQKQKLHACVEG